MNHASVFISQTYKPPYFVLWMYNCLMLCMWIGWTVKHFMKCFALYCVMCLSTLQVLSVITGANVPWFIFVSETIVCIDFVVMFTVGLGLVGALVLLEKAKLCTDRDFSGNVSYSGLVCSKKYLLNKWLSLLAVLYVALSQLFRHISEHPSCVTTSLTITSPLICLLICPAYLMLISISTIPANREHVS